MTAYIYQKNIIAALKFKKHPITISQAERKIVDKITVEFVRS
mgnify:CR=1 FL=1